MYIIYSGKVEVLINGNAVAVFGPSQLVGRTSLDNDAKRYNFEIINISQKKIFRNADLRSNGESTIFLLERNDYQIGLLVIIFSAIYFLFFWKKLFEIFLFEILFLLFII